MIVIQAKDQDDNWQVLDVFEDEPISLKYAFQELQEVNRPQGSHSNTVRIPATDTNNRYFEHAFDTRATDFNVKQKREANILQDGISILSGHIQLKRIYIVKEEFAEYEVVIFGETVDLGREIGDVLLSDLDWSSYVHAVDATNIDNSWSNLLFSGEIIYGFIDRGFAGWGIGGNPSAQSSAIDWDEMTPFVRVSTILDRIFANTNYSYSSDFFAAASNLYTPMFRGGARLPLSDSPSTQDLHVGITSTTTGTGTSFLMPMLDTGTSTSPYSDEYYDTNGLWNNSTYAYEPAALGSVVFVISYKVAKASGADPTKFKISAFADNSPALPNFSDGFLPISSEITLTNSGDVVVSDETAIFNIAPGMTYTFYIQMTQGDVSELSFEDFNLFVFADANADYTNAVNLNIPGALPEYKAIDYLLDLQTLFNLVIVPDRVNPNKVIIEPASDYLGTGDILDWTEKIDYGKDVVIEPTTDMQSRTYEWTYGPGDDILNAAFEQSAKRVYGRYKIFDTDNDFSTDEYVRSVGMAPYITNQTAGVLAFRGFDDSGEAITDAPPMIAFYNGTINFDWYLSKPGAGTLTSKDKFPVFSEFSDIVSDINTESLLFGPDTAHDIGVIPYITLYHKYWYDYTTNLYSSESRLLRANAFLTYADVATLNFADTIYLKDGPYRLISVDNYVANSEETCRITLLKVVTDAPRCRFTPNAITISGQVLFSDGASTGLTGNETCCELYGYNWTGSICSGRIGRPEINNGNGASGTTPVSTGKNITESTYVDEVSPIKSILDGSTDETMLVGTGAGTYAWENIGEAIAAYVAGTTGVDTAAVTGTTGILGDLNSDGQVGASDLLLMLSTYGDVIDTGFRFTGEGTNSVEQITVTNTVAPCALFGFSSVSVAPHFGISVDTTNDYIEITKVYHASGSFVTQVIFDLTFETDLANSNLFVNIRAERYDENDSPLNTVESVVYDSVVANAGTLDLSLQGDLTNLLTPIGSDRSVQIFIECSYSTSQGNHTAMITNLIVQDA